MNGEHWRDYFDSNYVGSWDLPKGRDTVMTITKVERGTLEGQKGKKASKAILYFRGAKKAFAANVTNCKTIAKLHGNNPREWVGKQIALYVAEDVDSPQGPVDAIRVRPRIPPQRAANSKGAPPPQTKEEAVPTPAEDRPEREPEQEWQPEEPPIGAEDRPEREPEQEWQPEEPPIGALESDHEQPV